MAISHQDSTQPLKGVCDAKSFGEVGQPWVRAVDGFITHQSSVFFDPPADTPLEDDNGHRLICLIGQLRL